MTGWQQIETAPKDREIEVQTADGTVFAQWRTPAWDDTGTHGYWLGPNGPVEATTWREAGALGEQADGGKA